MGAFEDCVALASRLREFVSPSRYELDWKKFPQGVWSIQYITGALAPAFERASRVYQTLDLPELSPSQVGSAWKVFLDGSVRVSREFPSWKVQMLKTLPVIGPLVALPASMAYSISSSIYGGLITALYYTSSSGALGHIAFKDKSTEQYSIHKMVIDGQLPEATAVAHAGWAYTGFSLISVLDEFGLLKPLKKPGMAGAPLGALPAVVFVGVVVLACIIAAAVVISKNLSEVNQLQAKTVEAKIQVMVDTCKNSKDPAIIKQCASGPTKDDLTGGSLANGINDAIKNASQDLAKYLAIGLGAFLVIQLLPHIIGRLKASAAEATS